MSPEAPDGCHVISTELEELFMGSIKVRSVRLHTYRLYIYRYFNLSWFRPGHC